MKSFNPNDLHELQMAYISLMQRMDACQEKICDARRIFRYQIKHTANETPDGQRRGATIYLRGEAQKFLDLEP